MDEILENILEIEAREDHFLEMEKKRDDLIKELQSLNNNLPVLVEQNKKSLLFKYNNNEFLEKYSNELNKIEDEQEVLIRNLRNALKEKAEKLSKTEHYINVQKKQNLSKDELINVIYDVLISERFKEVEFVV
ncbi:MAG: hypothetical protein ACRCXZ_07825 [Patescibacteria group bacterium]